MFQEVSSAPLSFKILPGIEKVHFIGICGVAMGTLAGMMKELGYRVTGSDEHFYPPMSDMLRKWGIAMREGFSGENVGSADLVIVGNAVSRGNPEAEHVLNRRIPYMSMAQALQTFILSGREVIAVAGTHGKTTTTALLAHILDTAGKDPSFLVGGVAINYDANYRLGRGEYFVIEGDEYDSAFFEKIPKFILYRPCHCLLTSLEFDHADIYSGLDEIKLWFKRLVGIVPSEGHIVYCSRYPALAEVTEKSLSGKVSYGAEGADYSIAKTGAEGDYSRLLLRTPSGDLELSTALIGEFNYANICAAAAMALRLGIEGGAVAEAVRTFRGVRRRQELIYSSRSVKVYEDFAHHPTAIEYMIRSMGERYPGARLWAVYEPRSATSRRNVFQDSLPGAFSSAHRVLIKQPYRLEGIRPHERIDIGAVVKAVNDSGGSARLYDRVEDMVRDIMEGTADGGENIIMLLSNGAFDGIYGMLTGALRSRGLP